MPKPLPPPWDRFVPFSQKVFVWSMVFGILWFVRPFFFLVFLTFVFGYVLHHFAMLMEPKIRSWRIRVVTGFLVLLAVLVGLGMFIGPALVQQGKDFPGQAEEHVGKLDDFIDKMREEYPTVSEVLPSDLKAKDVILGTLTSIMVPSDQRSTDPAKSENDQGQTWKNLVDVVRSFAESGFAISSAFLLSLLFSFLIVFDLPNLARSARHLHDTRLQFVYDEVSDNVFDFGRVLGQALEAQLVIAILNTLLTAIGLHFMGIPNIAFLSMVVFVCSFIPVAGVFISSVPICLTALIADDVGLMLWAIVFITVIHMIEAYILNPRIYGARLRMNPVIVLGILVISHHLFGLWGLILGVPVVTFIGKYVIEVKARRQSEGEAPTG